MQTKQRATEAPAPGYAVVPFTFRLSESLKGRLETAARRHGTSANAEIQNRLEASFREEELAGGAAMRDLTRLWVAAFLRGGSLGARVLGHPEWSVDQWMLDIISYRTAVHAGHDALIAAQPVDYKGEDVDPAGRANFEKLLDYFTQLVARGYAGYAAETEHQGDKK